MNHEYGFDDETVKQKIGTEHYNDFLKWMYGQTVMVHPETQETIYYTWDVERFKEGLERTVLRELEGVEDNGR